MAPPQVHPESGAVRAAWDSLTAAFLAGDWAPYREFFVDAPDFRMMHPDGREWLAGPAEFADVYKERIKGTSDWDVDTPRFEVSVSPGGSVAWTAAEVSIAASDWAQTSWQLAVWQKVEGRWRVASAMAAIVAPE
jgi:hypothetical protein